MSLQIKRAYEDPHKSDGIRILVDRLWPRGLSKEKAGIDLWLKEIAPSTALRKWFGHESEKWEKFKESYLKELEKNEDQVSLLKSEMKKGKVTLLYSAKDEMHNQALVLKEFMNTL